MATTTPMPLLPTPTRDRPRLVALALAAVYLIWGSTYLALKWMVEGLPPLLSAGLRYMLAGAVLFAFCRVRGASAPTARQWLASVPAGLGLFLVGNGFVTLAQREVSSSFSAIVCASMPLLLAVFNRVAGERLSRLEAVGLLVGFSGVVVMTTRELGAAPASASLILLAPVGWSLGTIAARRLAQAPGLVGASLQMLAGGTAILLCGALSGESLPSAEVPLASIASFFYLVVAGSLVAFSAYSYLLSSTRPSIATSYAYVNPVVAVGLGAMLGGETLSGRALAGGALVVLGVLLVVRARAR